MSYIVYAWITALLYASGALVGKFAAQHKLSNPWFYNFFWSLVVVLVSCIPALFFGVQHVTDWPSILFAGIMSAGTAVAYNFSVYMLDVSVLAPLYMLRTPISILLGSVVFGESLPLSRFWLIAVMTLAGIFVAMDERLSVRSFFKKTIAVALLTVTLSAVYNASVRFAVERNDYWTVVFWYNLLNQAFLLPTIPLFWKELAWFRLRDITHVSLSGLLAGVGGFAAIYATLGNLGVSMAIITLPLSTAAVMILARIKPGLLERHTPRVYVVRLTASIVMFAAALGLSTGV